MAYLDEPGPDFAESFSARATAWLSARPLLAHRLRTAYRVALWIAIPLVILVLLIVPGAGRTLPVTAGLLWLLLQVFLLARAKSLAWTTYARVFSASAVLTPVIGAIEVVVGRLFGWDAGEQAPSVVLAGPIEEALKLTPVVLILWLARNRAARLGISDFLLVGLASGAGFQLTEDAMRRVVDSVQGDPGGLAGILVGLLDLPDTETDYGLFDLLPGSQSSDIANFAGHGVLTALVAAAVGFAVLHRRQLGPRVWAVPAVAWLFAVADHVAYNYDVTSVARRLGAEDGAQVTLPDLLLDLHALTGNGALTGYLLLVVLGLATSRDLRIVSRWDDRLPPLPLAPDPRRSIWARMVDDLLVLLGGARCGPRIWLATMPWLRQRRELAYGLDTAAGGPRRRRPPEAELWDLGGRIGLALAGAAAALLAAIVFAPVAGVGEPMFLAGLFEGLGEWWGGLSLPEQLLLIAGVAGLLGLLGMPLLPALGLVGAASDVAEHGQGIAGLIRDPRKSLRDLTPGQVLALAIGLALERLIPAAGGHLIGSRVRRRVVHPHGEVRDPLKTLPIDQQELARAYRDSLDSFPTPRNSPADLYEIRQAGPVNHVMRSDDVKVHADGFRTSDGAVLEAKHVNKPGHSPYEPDSDAPDFLKQKARNEIVSELVRYKKVIEDPDLPVNGLEVITNNPKTADWIAGLMREYGVPGRVVISP